MSLWQRLLRALGYNPTPRVYFPIDLDLIQSLQQVADQEQRPSDEIVADLLSIGLSQHHATNDYLERWHSLTTRQQQVTALTCLNYTNRQIAARLMISHETVKTHLRNVLHKFRLHTKDELRQSFADWDFSAWDDPLF